jgi:ABC-type nitrate/sulfonate/bicarbonate transport system substrate-binding protein
MVTMRRCGLSRRRFLKTSAGAAVTAGLGALSTPAIGQGPTKIKMTLPWLPQGAQLFPFVARNKGYWRSRGLDVDIARGFGSGAAIQALSQGQFDVALIATPTVLLSNARGLDTISMGVAGYDITMGLMSLEDSAVKSVKDLEGRRLGSTPTSVEVPYIAPFLQRSGVDIGKVNQVQLAANVLETSLINKQVDAISAVATSNMPNLIAQGIKFRFFPFSNQGVKIYANAFLTTPQYLAANRGICQAWVEGLVDSLKFLMTNFDESVDIFLQEVPEVRMSSTGKEFTKLGAGLFLATQISPEVVSHGIGWIDMKSVGSQIDLVMQFVATKDAKQPVVGQTWSNDFVGKVKLTDAEIAAARGASGNYAKMLSFIT